MKLPELENPQKYTGLYVVDFGQQCSVGFTAEEVAELLESEKFKDITVYKIYNAYPDGRIELKGVRKEIFQLEAGMFFYSGDIDTAKRNFEGLVDLAIKAAVPGRAKVHMAKYSNQRFVTALIYPAEYDQQFSQWLLDADYRTDGAVAGGIGAVQSYYEQNPEIVEQHQIFAASAYQSKSGEQLLRDARVAVQR